VPACAAGVGIFRGGCFPPGVLVGMSLCRMRMLPRRLAVRGFVVMRVLAWSLVSGNPGSHKEQRHHQGKPPDRGVVHHRCNPSITSIGFCLASGCGLTLWHQGCQNTRRTMGVRILRPWKAAIGPTGPNEPSFTARYYARARALGGMNGGNAG